MRELARETVDNRAAAPAPGERCAEDLELPAPLRADLAIDFAGRSCHRPDAIVKDGGQVLLVARGAARCQAAPTATRLRRHKRAEAINNNPEHAVPETAVLRGAATANQSSTGGAESAFRAVPGPESDHSYTG